MSTAAIVLAGGSGSRLEHPDNKVFVPVAGRPLLAWSLRTFARSAAVSHLVIVVRAGEEHRVATILEHEPIRLTPRFTTGGRNRHSSEHAGLQTIAGEIHDGAIDVVLIHDAARPFASSDLIDRVAATARAVGGAVPALPLGDGVYRSDRAGGISRQPANLYRVQTPQGFVAAPLFEAHRRASADGLASVDTSETVMRYTDLEIAIVPGEATNIKVTFAGDLRAAEEIAAADQGSSTAAG